MATLRTTQGHEVHRWTDATGQAWACAVYDHGPFCRLCQPEDEYLAALLNQATEGNLDVQTNSEGGFAFAMTPKGTAEVDQTLAADPEMKAIYEDYKRRLEAGEV